MHLNQLPNIIVLCNNEVALPALQQLFATGSLKAILVPEKNRELLSNLQSLLAGSSVSLVSVNKKSLEFTIEKLVKEQAIHSAWMMTFPYIIPAGLLKKLPGGFINFHYGLLPEYRGVNPVFSQMQQGEAFGGITIHWVDEKIDTGAIVIQEKIPIEEDDTFGMQLYKLGMLGARLSVQLLQLHLGEKPLPATPQDESRAGYFAKPTAKDVFIHWETMDARKINRLVNACNPWNKGAGTIIQQSMIRITAVTITGKQATEPLAPGTIVALDAEWGLQVVCCDQKIIRLDIIASDQGFYTGNRLAMWGIKAGDRFISAAGILF